MNLSRKWLSEFVSVDANDRDFAEAMTLSGSKVEVTEDMGAEIVNVMPQPKAGSSFATAAYESFTHPVAVEEIRADAGLDIGGTLIGMHLKKVAVPVRLPQNHIGSAMVLAARVRPKFIGGDRAMYDDSLKDGYPEFCK